MRAALLTIAVPPTALALSRVETAVASGTTSSSTVHEHPAYSYRVGPGGRYLLFHGTTARSSSIIVRHGFEARSIQPYA